MIIALRREHGRIDKLYDISRALFFRGFLGFADLMRVICYFPLSGCISHASSVVWQCLFCISLGSFFTGENSA
jgi:hypothetical protein